MNECIKPLTPTQSVLISESYELAGPPPEGRPGLATRQAIRAGLKLAIQQSREPSEAEIETVIKVMENVVDNFNNCWAWYDIAKAAIRATRGLDAEATR